MSHKDEAKKKLERTKGRAKQAVSFAAGAVKEVVLEERQVIEEAVRENVANTKKSVGAVVEDIGQWIKK